MRHTSYDVCHQTCTCVAALTMSDGLDLNIVLLDSEEKADKGDGSAGDRVLMED